MAAAHFLFLFLRRALFLSPVRVPVVFLSTCMHAACMYVCMNVCMYIQIYAYIHTHIDTNIPMKATNGCSALSVYFSCGTPSFIIQYVKSHRFLTLAGWRRDRFGQIGLQPKVPRYKTPFQLKCMLASLLPTHHHHPTHPTPPILVTSLWETGWQRYCIGQIRLQSSLGLTG